MVHNSVVPPSQCRLTHRLCRCHPRYFSKSWRISCCPLSSCTYKVVLVGQPSLPTILWLALPASGDSAGHFLPLLVLFPELKVHRWCRCAESIDSPSLNKLCLSPPQSTVGPVFKGIFSGMQEPYSEFISRYWGGAGSPGAVFARLAVEWACLLLPFRRPKASTSEVLHLTC